MCIIPPPSVSLSAMVGFVLLLVLLASPSLAGDLEDQPTSEKLRDVGYVTTQISNHLWTEDVKSCFHMFGSWPTAAYMFEKERALLSFNDIDVSVTDCLDGPSDTSTIYSRMAVLDTKPAYIEGLGSTPVEFHWMTKSENPAQWADINAYSAGMKVCPPALASAAPEITWMLDDDFLDFSNTMTLKIRESAMATADPSNIVRLYTKASADQLRVDAPAEAAFKTAMTGKSLSPLGMAKLNNIPSTMRALMMAVVDTYEVSTWAEPQDKWYQFTTKDDTLANLRPRTTAKLVDDWSLAAPSRQLGHLALTKSSGTPCMAIDNMHGEEKIVFADTSATDTELVTSCCIPTAATPLEWNWPPHMIATRNDWAVYRDPSCLSHSQDFLSNMPFGPTPCHCGSYAPVTDVGSNTRFGEWKVTDGGKHQLEPTTSCASPADVRSTSSSAKSPKSVKAAKSAKSTK